MNHPPRAVVLLSGGHAQNLDVGQFPATPGLLLIKTAGFIPAGAVLFAATARGFGSSRAGLDLAIGAVAALLIYLFFVKLLGLTLPSGLTESWM